jgi:hypothetical protein
VGDERRGTFLYLNDGTGAFPEELPVVERQFIPYALAAGDLNGDSFQDLIIGCASGPGLLLINDGTGRTFRRTNFGDGVGAVYGISVGDLDRDGQLDLAVGRSGAANAIYLSGPVR